MKYLTTIDSVEIWLDAQANLTPSYVLAGKNNSAKVYKEGNFFSINHSDIFMVPLRDEWNRESVVLDFAKEMIESAHRSGISFKYGLIAMDLPTDNNQVRIGGFLFKKV